MKRFLAFVLLLGGVAGGSAVAQTGSPIAVPHFQFSDANGVPLAGGFVFTCVAGSTCPGTPQSSYSNAAGALNANPIVLDATGSAELWGGGLPYKLVVEDLHNVVQWTDDNVPTIASAVSVFPSPAFTGIPTAPTAAPGTNTNQIATTAFVDALFPAHKRALIGMTSTGALTPGPVINVTDYPYAAIGDGVTDNHTRFAAAVAALPSTGGEIDLPCGNFFMGSTWIINPTAVPIVGARITVHGQGGCSIISGTAGVIVEVKGYNGIQFENLAIAESNLTSGNALTVGLWLYDAANVSLENVVFQGAPVDAFLGVGLKIQDLTCANVQNTQFTEWNYGVQVTSSDSTVSTCLQFSGQSRAYRNNYGFYAQWAELNLANITVDSNQIAGVFCGSCFMKDFAVHYEDANLASAATPDVQSVSGVYQSISSDFLGSGVFVSGSGPITNILMAGGSGFSNISTGGNCSFLFPRNSFTLIGTGICSYMDYHQFLLLNPGGGGYAMNLGGPLNVTGGVTATGAIAAASTVTASGFAAGGGASAGATATLACSGGQHVSSITVVGGLVTSVGPCN